MPNMLNLGITLLLLRCEVLVWLVGCEGARRNVIELRRPTLEELLVLVLVPRLVSESTEPVTPILNILVDFWLSNLLSSTRCSLI